MKPERGRLRSSRRVGGRRRAARLGGARARKYRPPETTALSATCASWRALPSFIARLRWRTDADDSALSDVADGTVPPVPSVGPPADRQAARRRQFRRAVPRARPATQSRRRVEAAPPATDSNSPATARLLAEAQTIAKVRHPNVVTDSRRRRPRRAGRALDGAGERPHARDVAAGQRRAGRGRSGGHRPRPLPRARCGPRAPD